MRWPSVLALVAALVVVAAVAAPVRAADDGVVPGSARPAPDESAILLSVGAGAYLPFRGLDAGYSVLGQLLWQSRSGHWRYGPEFEFRHYHQDLLWSEDLETFSYLVRGLLIYSFLPGERINPYVGLGLAFELYSLDNAQLEIDAGFSVLEHVGIGAGLQLVVGADFELSQHFSLFAEGRAGYSVFITRVDADTYPDTLQHESTSGASFSGGVRYRF